MKIYTIKRSQFLPVSLQEAWDFFSNPTNLSIITPTHMNFRIVYTSGGKNMFAGKLIQYKINVFPWITTNWLTEITQVNYLKYFIDEQRIGPYALWHHEHRFKETTGRVEMIDEVAYAIPYGAIGTFANTLFVGKMVNAIFDHRSKVIQDHFLKLSS
jgi:ligand-binding SRPBCC domain-containing protein